MDAIDTPWTLKDRHPGVVGGRKPRSGRACLKSIGVDRDKRTVKGIVAADVLDIEGEVIQPGGLRFGPDQYFMGITKAVYLDHAWASKTARPIDKLPVAMCRQLAHRGDELYSLTYICKTTIGDELIVLIDEGALSGLSIGAVADEDGEGPPNSAELKRYGPKCSYVMRSGMMLEYSLVSMPANPRAVLKCLSDGSIRRTTASLFMPEEVTPSREVFPVSGKAKCGKRIVLDANFDLIGVIG